MPGQPGNLLDRHTLVGFIMLTNEVRSSFGTQQLPSPAAAVTLRKSRRRLCDSYGVPIVVVNTRPCSCHNSPALGALFGLASHLRSECVHSDLGKLQRPARPIGLGIAVGADRPPHRDRPGVEVHVIPRPSAWSK